MSQVGHQNDAGLASRVLSSLCFLLQVFLSGLQARLEERFHKDPPPSLRFLEQANLPSQVCALRRSFVPTSGCPLAAPPPTMCLHWPHRSAMCSVGGWPAPFSSTPG